MKEPGRAAVAICPVCRSGRSESFFREPDANLWQQFRIETLAEALSCPRADIDLHVCLECLAIWNVAFDPDRLDYHKPYDATQSGSEVFRNFVGQTAARLVKAYGLVGKRAVDIGSGDGRFLEALSSAGLGEVLGIEPSWPPDAVLPRGVRVVAETFPLSSGMPSAELISCRHVLSHVSDPAGFVGSMRAAADADDAVFFLEVPNFEVSLSGFGPLDIYYEHHLYFTAAGFRHLLQRCGLLPVRLEAEFSAQYLCADARVGDSPTASASDREKLLLRLGDFEDDCTRWLAEIRSLFDGATGPNILWGAGGRAVALLNLAGITSDLLPHVIDINSNKWRTFIPGTGQEITGPEVLRDIQAGRILVVNPAYLDEVRRSARELGWRGQVVALPHFRAGAINA